MNKKMKVLLVGNPNVGKSALFNALTGKYVAVSNYPGTTVEYTKGEINYKGYEIEIIDTPGMYSMLPISEEEKVARNLIFKGDADCIVNVIDAKNLERMLPLTFQLIETGIPVILVLNMIDEAKRLGINIDIGKLSNLLGIPVIPTVSIKKVGVKDLLEEIIKPGKSNKKHVVVYDNEIEEKIEALCKLIEGKYSLSKRLISIMLIHKDEELLKLVSEQEKKDFVNFADEYRRELEKIFRVSVDYLLALKRQLTAQEILSEVLSKINKVKENKVLSIISAITIHPFWGYPILFFVLYFGLYRFVGQVGAGTLVDFIETDIFEALILPRLIDFIERSISSDIIKELVIRDYGIVTLGIKYAVAIILPIVSTFFLFFSVLEDSGYLPRLAFLLDRIFKKIGLTGKAVIPLVLGFGCDTMATMVTRTLNSKKERIIATILLSLAVPCSAQLGVMLAVLSSSSILLSIWIFILLFVFFVVGYFSSYFIKGEKTIFFVEIPPMRIPKLSNILVKTYTRLIWYFKEVIPLFIYASIFIWIGRIIGIFDFLIKLIAIPLKYIGLPQEAAKIFLFGFFRRDYGAAGLYDFHKQGVFNNNQLLILAVMLTLFLPCIAQFIMTIKERGFKMGIYIAVFVMFFSTLTGYLLHLILNIILGVNL
jgi:ferrous iron transport protein B